MNKTEIGEKIWELRQKGYSIRKISELTGVNRCIVSAIINYTKPPNDKLLKFFIERNKYKNKIILDLIRLNLEILTITNGLNHDIVEILKKPILEQKIKGQ
jgi:transcriptional regulator with XRE-family HTH domain